MKNKIFIYLIIAATFTFIKCSKKDFELSDPSSVDVTQFYKTPADAEQAVMACYDSWSFILFDTQGVGIDVLSEDVWNGTSYDKFTTSSQDSYVENIWKHSFHTIAWCNVALDKIPGTTITDAKQQKQLIAEAKFLRAWTYMYLVGYYGSVPLIIKSPDLSNPDPASLYASRAPLANVWAQIEKDLAEAYPDLPQAYDDKNLGRATKGAAMGYLGKAFLFQKKYAEAKAILKQVMDLKGGVNQAKFDHYDLLDQFGDNFHGNPDEWSKEAIFQINYINAAVSIMWGGGGNNVIWKMLGWGLGRPNLYAMHVFEPSDSARLFTSIGGSYVVKALGDTVGNRKSWKAKAKQRPWNSITEDDLQMGKYILLDTINNQWGHWDGTGVTEGNNVNLMRFSDVLLMYAEAVNELNDPATAIVNLNIVRGRAKVTTYPYGNYNASYLTISGDGSQGDVRNAIKHERQVEFYWEKLHFLDLVRWGDCVAAFAKANAYEISMGSTTPKQDFVKNKSELFPIPSSETTVNPNIGANNPGY